MTPRERRLLHRCVQSRTGAIALQSDVDPARDFSTALRLCARGDAERIGWVRERDWRRERATGQATFITTLTIMITPQGRTALQETPHAHTP